MKAEPQQRASIGVSGHNHTRLGISSFILYPSSFIIRRDWLPLLVLALAALTLCWPLLQAPRTRIIGPPVGDNVQYVYMTGWVGQSLLLGQSPLVDPRLNFPGTLALATTDAPFLSMLLAAPFTWALGPVFAYNLIHRG